MTQTAHVLLGVGVCGIAIFGVLIATPAAHSATLSNPGDCDLSTQDLAGSGIALSATSEAVGISEASARAAAIAQLPGAKVDSVALVHLSDPTQPKLPTGPVWAIRTSSSPFVGSYGPAEDNPQRLTPACSVVFIDARTGAFVFGMQSGALPSEP